MIETLLEDFKKLLEGWKVAHATKLERQKIIKATNLERWIVVVFFAIGLGIITFFSFCYI
jgi:hypothetical protein